MAAPEGTRRELMKKRVGRVGGNGERVGRDEGGEREMGDPHAHR